MFSQIFLIFSSFIFEKISINVGKTFSKKIDSASRRLLERLTQNVSLIKSLVVCELCSAPHLNWNYFLIFFIENGFETAPTHFLSTTHFASFSRSVESFRHFLSWTHLSVQSVTQWYHDSQRNFRWVVFVCFFLSFCVKCYDFCECSTKFEWIFYLK